MALWWSRSTSFLLFTLLPFLQFCLAAENTQWIQTTAEDGSTIYLPDSRKPSLYTGNFGDCLGSSLINVTRFDAAYYKDNMTVLFHLAGNTGIRNESLMMYIGVYAYGESRFDLTFNPCNANIASLCPMRENVTIEANGIIPIAPVDVANIPPIALVIPDFEGEAILRIFANSTESEIGCFSAVITNGNTFSHPAAVGTVLGIFAAVAVLASFATAIYGNSIPVTRTHYAHSLSVLVVFVVLQHIFFTGALSMNWPSALVAFWSNYAWAGGMIHTQSMQNSINRFIGSNKGNTTQVGAAGAGVLNEELGGGYDIRQIYRRANFGLLRRDVIARGMEHKLSARALANSSSGYDWYGDPVAPGLPLPGNYSGFAGTLGQESIPASNAFMTGFLWLLTLIAIVAASVIFFKWLLEGLSLIKLLKRDRLSYFRSHWLGYTVLAVLRTLFIAFFMMMFLTLFQFTYHGAAGVIAVAAIVFLIFFVGMFGLAAYACFYRIRFGKYASQPDRLNLERRRVLGFIPWYRFYRASTHQQDTEKVYAGSIPFWRVSPAGEESTKSIHDDEDYTKKFGWLAARFRRTRWWFFLVWLVYEFVRACFYAGASGHPMTQVFGLLVVEIIAFVVILILKPFEGQRLNAIVVYLLGFSKVATVALSAAFDIRFNIPRITATAIGIVIIVIQGLLTIALLITIVLGAISSYMSLTRNRETFKPRSWIPLRERYFKHINARAADVPAPPPPAAPEEPKEPYFSVTSVRRMAKIEDEDPDFQPELTGQTPNSMSQTKLDGSASANASRVSINNTTGPTTRASRAMSVHSQMSYSSLPYGARPHRASWSTKEFLEFQENERRRTIEPSTGPLVEESQRPVSGIGPRHAPSDENTQRVASPFAASATASAGSVGRPRTASPLAVGVGGPVASRPRTSGEMGRTVSPIHRPKHSGDLGRTATPLQRPKSRTPGPVEQPVSGMARAEEGLVEVAREVEPRKELDG